MGVLGEVVLGTVSTVFIFISLVFTCWEWSDNRIGRVSCFFKISGYTITFIFIINKFWEVF